MAGNYSSDFFQNGDVVAVAPYIVRLFRLLPEPPYEPLQDLILETLSSLTLLVYSNDLKAFSHLIYDLVDLLDDLNHLQSVIGTKDNNDSTPIVVLCNHRFCTHAACASQPKREACLFPCCQIPYKVNLVREKISFYLCLNAVARRNFVSIGLS